MNFTFWATSYELDHDMFEELSSYLKRQNQSKTAPKNKYYNPYIVIPAVCEVLTSQSAAFELFAHL